MKVWIVSDGEPLPVDGENTRLRRMGNLANYLSDKGHTVTWFAKTFDHHKKKQRADKDVKISVRPNYTLNLSYVEGYKKNVSIGRLLSRYKTAERINSKFFETEKPDIIIATMAHVDLTNYACEYGLKYDVPVVVDVRDLWPAFIGDMVKPIMRKILIPYIKYHELKLSKMMKKAYAIIGLSDYFLEYGLKYAKRARKTEDTVIPIGYPNYDYTNFRGRINGYWNGLNDNDFIIACTGTFSQQFDYSSVIEASRLLEGQDDIKFVLCGTGVQFDSIKNRVGANVIMPGWVEKEQISSLLINSKVGLIPYIDGINYRGNTPNKFGEYLSANLPILVSVTGSMEKLLKENKCGYFYSNGKDLAEKILDYRNNSQKQRADSKNSRTLYERMFNGDKVTVELADYLLKTAKTYKK
ncbi:glycosyltransferase [Niallia endozanthoxylica]|uniref:Glycosyltransferase family 4 protein n=1 Tax=Niallia endozanthoxylica TaxID=2036016 RepID=A0A5J5H1S8_9BACI|nr:glycosyltransferase [Niallia endozanthoxylica]KAA9013823.1 glycosyltransferase family 4 protein [Niallia endozanthoxylica]